MSKLKFPNPADYPAKTPGVLCPADRVIGLYNQATNKTAKRISKTVREWFFPEAHARGWAGAHFLPEVQSQHGAGCLLWVTNTNIKIKVTAATLVLVENDTE